MKKKERFMIKFNFGCKRSANKIISLKEREEETQKKTFIFITLR